MSFLIPGLLLAGKAVAGAYGASKQKQPEVPPWLLDILKENALKDRTTGFLPDRGAFTRAADAGVADIFSQLPAGIESFNTEAAARGQFTSGEASKYQYQNVFAPVARAAASVQANAQLGFEGLTLEAKTAGEQLNQQALALLAQAVGKKTENPSFLDGLIGGLGDVAGVGAKYDLLKQQGAFG